jgi:ubiquinone/menaquinone biosynthesis C-methylase UbiE
MEDLTMSAALPSGFIAGNHFDKYRSEHRLHRWLMDGFLRAAVELLEQASPSQIFEIGCGPGDLAARLLSRARLPRRPQYLGIDLAPDQIAMARDRYPNLSFDVASAYRLPCADGAVDLAIACEVCEHLEEPHQAVRELARITRRYALISTPWEPVWRGLNMLRGKYLATGGNTPGHVQHFTRRGLRTLVEPYFDVIAVRRPLPWTMLLVEKR